MNGKNNSGLDERSLGLRRMIVKTLGSAGRGHLGPAFSIVEIITVLYDKVMKFKPGAPEWNGRDRFILSKGHGCAALYVMLADKGFFSCSELERFCKYDGLLGGHPEFNIPGVEASTGSLGHGLSIGIGMALNARLRRMDYNVYVLLGDGECGEGSIWEGAMSASKHGLENLVAIVDYNKSQAYGSTSEVLDLEPFADKWRGFGFGVVEVDGHDVGGLLSAFKNAPARKGKPTAVICHTVKGKGAPFTENNMEWHHKNKISDQDIDLLLKALEA
ncbi:MAG TPA: transketolase [Nitrospirae bacterium]|nr:transketolase [Nitrospirota bacterium]